MSTVVLAERVVRPGMPLTLLLRSSWLYVGTICSRIRSLSMIVGVNNSCVP